VNDQSRTAVRQLVSLLDDVRSECQRLLEQNFDEAFDYDLIGDLREEVINFIERLRVWL
jgi:hypothetical protein